MAPSNHLLLPGSTRHAVPRSPPSPHPPHFNPKSARSHLRLHFLQSPQPFPYFSNSKMPATEKWAYSATCSLPGGLPGCSEEECRGAGLSRRRGGFWGAAWVAAAKLFSLCRHTHHQHCSECQNLTFFNNISPTPTADSVIPTPDRAGCTLPQADS